MLALAATATARPHVAGDRLRPAVGARRSASAAALGDALLLAGLALAVVAALPAVGALLVGTLLVVPAATARLLTDDVHRMQPLAVALAAATASAAC